MNTKGVLTMVSFHKSSHKHFGRSGFLLLLKSSLLQIKSHMMTRWMDVSLLWLLVTWIAWEKHLEDKPLGLLITMEFYNSCTKTKTTSNKGHYVYSRCASTLIPMTQQGHYKYRLYNDNVHAQVQHL